AANWAAQAKVGQYLGIGGPRGSLVIPTAFDWHVLVGDDTALPAIARRLEELPAGARAAAVIEVADPSAQIEFTTQAELHLVWCHRSEARERGSALLQAVREIYLPEHGEGYVWAAGESATMRAVRQHLCAERGVDKSRIRAASYWKQGAQAVHESLDD
ncbi:NADPH-dependent ferric siderophore reductase, partial [Burkholderia sp. SG-MS1]|uniref:siderophore-interacting protein n=1 Tax=Paraburkholderia sp. SG-MS1 TaxID=2023741 RepID=UPI0014480149